MSVEQGVNVVEIGMPRLSDSMEEATVSQWLKQPGDTIRKGEPMVEVETDKATIVYESELDGVLEEIVVAAGETALLGAVIARVRAEGSARAAAPAPTAAGGAAPAPTDAAAAEPAPAPAAPPVEAAPAYAPAAALPPRSDRQRATPVARRVAAELGVALEGVSGTGPGGRIVRADVRAAGGNGRPAQPAAAAPVAGGRGSVDTVTLSTVQRTIAQRMSLSRTDIPEFTLEAEVDMEAAAQLRDDLKAAGYEPAPSFNDLVVRAAALALKEFPGLNAAYEDGVVHRYGRINVGIAVATEDALLVPTILDADKRSVLELAVEARRLAEKVRTKSIALDDLADGTFTISNLGMFGVRRFTAVINHPQAAILAVGEVALRPMVGPDGAVTAARLMDISLSCDHRAVYGADGARFLQRLRHLLEHPVQLVIDRKD